MRRAFPKAAMRTSLLSAVVTSCVFTACGRIQSEESTLASEKFSIAVLGIEMGSCTRDELSRFIAGETVPAISGKLSADQQRELRTKFARVLTIAADKSDEALNSPAGGELRSLLKRIFPASYSDADVKKAFEDTVADNSFTLLEFVSAYPSTVMRVNGIAFLNQKDNLEAVLVKMEKNFGL